MSFLLFLLLLNCYCAQFHCLNNKKPQELIETQHAKNISILSSNVSDITSRFLATNNNHQDATSKEIKNLYDNLRNRENSFEFLKPEKGIKKNLLPSLLLDTINQKKVSKRDTNDDAHMMIGTFQAIMRPMSVPAGNYLGIVNESWNGTEKA